MAPVIRAMRPGRSATLALHRDRSTGERSHRESPWLPSSRPPGRWWRVGQAPVSPAVSMLDPGHLLDPAERGLREAVPPCGHPLKCLPQRGKQQKPISFSPLHHAARIQAQLLRFIVVAALHCANVEKARSESRAVMSTPAFSNRRSRRAMSRVAGGFTPVTYNQALRVF